LMTKLQHPLCVSHVIRETTFALADDTNAGAVLGKSRVWVKTVISNSMASTQGEADHALPKQLVDADDCCS
jgi:hypothetical protein